eukprot:CAMPEP_0206405074 /NCGR_PEP_ID=MMETSP0294-20121207/28834_1 /ASSEMBLY_ACC=CAM_ASM_000327 /TAXON_ID=39354 /ORGANISM="Heterosigma akashiwo, Strain CCMP2393" /LENGTH=86 /DNA_ID=CAMNT_0053863267 /DNA_START=50 /DNA_END=306 /DNA_ORIENTATION=-
MATKTAEIKVGSTVTTGGKTGIVRFVGETQFSTGVWVGVELPVPEGKNDGSVQGVKYFDAPDKHGLFVRPASVEVVGEGAAAAAAA